MTVNNQIKNLVATIDKKTYISEPSTYIKKTPPPFWKPAPLTSAFEVGAGFEPFPDGGLGVVRERLLDHLHLDPPRVVVGLPEQPVDEHLAGGRRQQKTHTVSGTSIEHMAESRTVNIRGRVLVNSRAVNTE